MVEKTVKNTVNTQIMNKGFINYLIYNEQSKSTGEFTLM